VSGAEEEAARYVEAKPMMLLPPHPSLCQECAHEHAPEEPHNLTLFYAVKFKMDHGREPTWDDALAHVSDELHELWRGGLVEHGVEVKAR